MLKSLPWLVLLVYWAIGAVQARRTAVKEPLTSRLFLLIVMVAAYSLLFSERLNLGVLGLRFLPYQPAVRAFGIVLTYLGVAFAIWARFHLGRNWSARITLKVGHELIRSGPYRYIRHPIYSGILLAATGTALAEGRWRAVLGVSLILLGYIFKARKEERLLAGQVGENFDEHRKRTGMLLPRF